MKALYQEVGFDEVQSYYPMEGDPFHLSPAGGEVAAAQFFRILKCQESEALSVLQPFFTGKCQLSVDHVMLII